MTETITCKASKKDIDLLYHALLKTADQEIFQIPKEAEQAYIEVGFRYVVQYPDGTFEEDWPWEAEDISLAPVEESK